MKNAPANLNNFKGIDTNLKNSFDYKLEYEFFHNFESAHTRKSYRSDLLQFFEFLKDNFQTVLNYQQIKLCLVYYQ